jgi:hypothetical protein
MPLVIPRMFRYKKDAEGALLGEPLSIPIVLPFRNLGCPFFLLFYPIVLPFRNLGCPFFLLFYPIVLPFRNLGCPFFLTAGWELHPLKKRRLFTAHSVTIFSPFSPWQPATKSLDG